MRKLLNFILLLVEITKDSNALIAASSKSAEFQDQSAAASIRRTCRTIVISMIVFLVLGLIVVPFLGPIYGVWKLEIHPDDAKRRALMGIIFSLFAIPAHVYSGISLGCLLAPKSFLEGKLGQQWLELIGTETASQGRAVCWIVLLVELAMWGGLSYLLLSMAPMV